jgi:hypothetical protein
MKISKNMDPEDEGSPARIVNGMLEAGNKKNAIPKWS